MQSKRRRSGFTLIEMIVVIGIIIMVTAMMVPMIGSFLGGSGIQSGQRIVQGVLLRARSMAVNLRRTIAVSFDHSTDAANQPANWMGNHVTATNTDALESYWTGKLIIWDIAEPTPADPTVVNLSKVPGESTLPKNVNFIFSPDFCAFNADGSMIMGNWASASNPIVESDDSLTAAGKVSSPGTFVDASSNNFETECAAKIRAGELVNSGLGTTPPYDIKIIRKGAGGKACYANLVRLTGRLGKWMVGDREEQ